MGWEKKEIPPELIRRLQEKYGCSPLCATILARRGITRGEELRYYLEDDVRHLRSPFELPNMEDAVDRILAAREEGEKVLVFGDRDVDGISATALLAGGLRSLGMEVSWRLPGGEEAYGLSLEALRDFADGGGTLIITVDCGISNIKEAQAAREMGVDLIITDHHNPGEILPEAVAIVNPKLGGKAYPFQGLAGCGVAFKLIQAVRIALRSDTYGHSLCLLNTRPSNDSYIIEIAKLRNLVEVDRLVETLVPGMLSISETRLPRFLEGQQIMAWDAPLQKKTLEKIFGKTFEIYLLDLAGEIGKEIPQTQGKSLLRIREISKIARYQEEAPGELDVFINLFTTFIQRREKHFSPEDRADLQLAALGTVADLMPLEDENRIIVRSGLESLSQQPRRGLQDLLLKLGISGRRIEGQEISWQLAPAINAAGRMGHPEKAAELFLEEDKQRRGELAAEIIAMNEDRKKKGTENWLLVRPRAEENLEFCSRKLALAYGEDIFRGVTGIMATRLVHSFKIPAMVVSFSGDTATGSLRSVKGWDVLFLLREAGHLLRDWGGHDYAAGFSLDRSNWEAFLALLQQSCRALEISPEKGEESILIDAELPAPYLDPEKILPLVDLFEPFGTENPPLQFLARSLLVSDLTFMGKTEKSHVKLTLDTGKFKWPAIIWQGAERVKRDFDLKDRVDLVFTVNRNWFNGNEIPQMIVTDLVKSGGT